MSTMLLLELTRSRRLKTLQVPVGTTPFKVPLGTTKVSLIGKGGPGSPGGSYTYYTYLQNRVIFGTRRSDGVRVAVSSQYSGPFDGRAPGNYCNGVNVTPTDPVYATNQTCYLFEESRESGSSPTTTGASTTAFGQVFVGGYGGPATPREVNNLTVNPGQTYNLVVPSGGSLTVTYLE